MDRVAVMNDKAGRFRDFFDLQLRFAEAIAQKLAIPVDEAVLRYTNFHRRFGLNDVTPDGPHPSWHVYALELSRLASHEARARWTQDFYARAPEERLAFPDHLFGCFYFHAGGDSEIVRLHFYNRDPLGPLSKARAGERRRELTEMFACIRRRFPHVTHVEGRSWLYGTEAYRRLFPEDYVRSRVAMENDARFQGMSRWGQFLNREGKVKPALKETFLHDIGRLDADRLWQAFPLPSFRVSAPIDAFYTHYGISAC
jgi:hypothetical protein